MLMFRRTHERLMAELRTELREMFGARLEDAEDKAVQWERLAGRLMDENAAHFAKLADFADRSLPPPRITSVQQPKSITEADTNAAKKLRGVK